MKAQTLSDLLCEFPKVAAGNALAAGNFIDCTCPKPPGLKTKNAEDIIEEAHKDPNTAELDRLIESGHTEFLRRCYVFHPDGEVDRLAKKDEWILLNPSNGDECQLTTPLARAYGHLRAYTHLPETHTDETSKTAATYQRTPAKLNLGNGYVLTYTPHPMETQSNTWIVEWETPDEKYLKEPYKIGEVTIDFYKNVEHPSINTISLDSRHQRQGLGRSIIQVLAKFYGGLTSDPQRNTNPLAKGMWRGVPGVQEVPAPKEFQHGPKEKRLPWETDEFLTKGKYFTVDGNERD